MKIIDGHICNGGRKIKGLIIKYPLIFCSLCHYNGSIDIQMTEEHIDAYNKELLENIKENK